jgi:hypothetical protein
MLTAVGVLSLWIAALSLPMWSGMFVAGPWSDQYESGFAIRQWAADQWRALGHPPLWNPAIFGGLPFVGAMHGDIFYPTAWLRLALPIATAMNLGFVIHYLLAGFFVYLLLRMLRVSWAGAVTGGSAYQLSGVIGTYVAPGHDGKLFVTALLPLACIALLLAIKRNRAEGHALLAITIGLGVVSPHPQMLYYLLVAAGLFALYLAFADPDRPSRAVAVGHLGGALAAVVLGVGIGMIQVLPFFEHIPLSPRADTYRGFEGATSYAIPWSHVPEFFLSGFTGASQASTYWASNPIKLHSEYLGLSVIALAVLGAFGTGRRGIVVWLSGIATLFLLVGLGAGTPFYRVWYELMPYMKQVRAPGMALYIVAFVIAVFAAFGMERLERGEGRGHARVWLVTGIIVAAFAAIGGAGGLARGIAELLELPGGRAIQMVVRAQDSIRAGAIGSGVALAALGMVVEAHRRRMVPLAGLALAIPLVVGGDLWRSARPFWVFSDIEHELLASDPIIEHVRATDGPNRILQIAGAEVYRGNVLMAHDVLQLLGYHGNEIHRFDELMGGRLQWDYVASPRLWDLFAVRYLITPTGVAEPEGFSRILTAVETGSGTSADLFERNAPVRWARVVPAAVKVPDEQAIPAIVNPQSVADPNRVVLLAPDAPIEPSPLDSLPDRLDTEVHVASWAPGAMRLRIIPAAPSDAYLVVGENWYPSWKATIDGADAPVLRGNVSLITVPLPEGAHEIELRYESSAYALGRLLSFLSLAVALVAAVVPMGLRRIRKSRHVT